MASIAPAQRKTLSFWQKMALGITGFTLFGFIQFTARGFVDVAAVPFWIHLHAVVMLGWLGLFIAQPSLVRKGDLAAHRRFGIAGLLLAVVVVALGAFSAIMTVARRHVPFFFDAPYFLTLNLINLTAFGLLVSAAIYMAARNRLAHPRLIVSANVLILEPSLGRLLPFPLIQPFGEVTVMLVQLGVLALLARHDRASLGRVHGTTLAGFGVVLTVHALIEIVGRLPATTHLATSLAQG